MKIFKNLGRSFPEKSYEMKTILKIFSLFAVVSLLLLKFGSDSGALAQDIPESIAASVPVPYFYVTNPGDNTIKKFDTSGNNLGNFAIALNGPEGITFDGLGNLYLADISDSRIYRYNLSGTPTLVADAGVGLSNPSNVVFDAYGNLYVSNTGDDFIRKRDAAGNWTAFTNAVSSPFSLAVDSYQNLYVLNGGNNTVTKNAANGRLLGNFGSGYSFVGGDASGGGLAFDPNGNLFVANYASKQIRVIKPDGTLLTTYSSASNTFAPIGIVFDQAGAFYVVSRDNTIHKFNSSGTDLGIFGSGLNFPSFIALGPFPTPTPTPTPTPGIRNLYVANVNAGNIHRYGPDGTDLGIFGTAPNAFGLAFDAQGNLFVSCIFSSTIQRFDPVGNQSLFANSGSGLNEPKGMAFDASGKLYVANYGSGNIEVFDSTGHGATFLTGAHVTGPLALAFDSSGNLWISNIDDTVSKFLPNGTYSSVTYSGFSFPTAIAFDANDNLYVTSANTGLIDKIAPNGTRVTFSAPGLSDIHGITFDDAGYFYIVQEGDNTLHKFSPNGLDLGIVASNLSEPELIAFGPSFTVSVSASPAEGGTASGGGSYADGASVTVIATANSCYHFANWTESGSIVPGADASYTFPAGGNRTLVANFIKNNYAISASAGSGGSVGGAGNYDCGTQATLTATPDSCHTFTSWTESGTVVSTQASYSFTVSGDRTLTANFTIKHDTITTSAGTGGTASGDGTFTCGSSVTVLASPDSCHTFANWSDQNGIIQGAGASYTFTASGNRTLTASFNPINYTINATAGSNGTVSGGGSKACGSSATVVATPNAGYSFVSWSDSNGVISGAGQSYTFTVNGDRTLAAAFADVTPPVITVPAPNAVEADGSDGAVVTFTAPTANDSADGAVAVSCNASSGATFSIGTTTVSCSASDSHGNTSNSSFNVVVRDTTPPVITTPGDINVKGGKTGGFATFSACATDLVDGSVTSVSYSPPSGSTLPLGTTTVTVTATDSHGNTSSDTFHVQVLKKLPKVSKKKITPTASISASATTINEGDTITFNLSATGVVDQSNPVSVPYTLSGTAVEGTHYTIEGGCPSHQIIFPANSPSGQIALKARKTSLTSGSETITLTIQAGTGYTVSSTQGSATVTINNSP